MNLNFFIASLFIIITTCNCSDNYNAENSKREGEYDNPQLPNDHREPEITIPLEQLTEDVHDRGSLNPTSPEIMGGGNNGHGNNIGLSTEEYREILEKTRVIHDSLPLNLLIAS